MLDIFESPLTIAVKKENIEIIQLLLLKESLNINLLVQIKIFYFYFIELQI